MQSNYVMNPFTGRKVKIGGKAHKNMLSKQQQECKQSNPSQNTIIQFIDEHQEISQLDKSFQVLQLNSDTQTLTDKIKESIKESIQNTDFMQQYQTYMGEKFQNMNKTEQQDWDTKKLVFIYYQLNQKIDIYHEIQSLNFGSKNYTQLFNKYSNKQFNKIVSDAIDICENIGLDKKDILKINKILQQQCLEDSDEEPRSQKIRGKIQCSKYCGHYDQFGKNGSCGNIIYGDVRCGDTIYQDPTSQQHQQACNKGFDNYIILI